MLAKQLKHEESSMEASSSELATQWKCHESDIVAAHTLVQMANEDSGLLHQRPNLLEMKGMSRMRWETKDDSYSEVDRKNTKFLEKGKQVQILGGQMRSDEDNVVLRYERRKHRNMNSGMKLSSLPSNHKNYNSSEDDDKSIDTDAAFEDPHDELGVSRVNKRNRVAVSCFNAEIEDVQEGRFIGMKSRMNIATLNPSSKEVRARFRKEETLRYSVPGKGFCYTALDGGKSAVAPISATKMKKNPQYHVILKPDRPHYVYTLCLVRDAAARLPGGVGTRKDICTLMRDSQYLAEDASDEQLNQVASKGLDRLHYEVDPCVRYDGKVWVYLHRNRGEDDFEDNATSSAYIKRKYGDASWSNASTSSSKKLAH